MTAPKDRMTAANETRSMILLITDGESFWRGIRDGGSKSRRRSMYAFLSRHRDGKGVEPHTRELHHMYNVCLRTAKELSRTKGYSK